VVEAGVIEVSRDALLLQETRYVLCSFALPRRPMPHTVKPAGHHCGRIPIAMPTVLSVTLALGAYQLAKHGAIVARMSAVEEWPHGYPVSVRVDAVSHSVGYCAQPCTHCIVRHANCHVICHVS